MRSGWKPFWAALGAALLVLLPLVGGTVLLTRHAARARLQTAESQSGVPIALPKDTDRMTLLVCIADEPPGFVLLYLNAVQNCLDLLTLPAETCVAFGGQDVTLARCYAAAGPAPLPGSPAHAPLPARGYPLSGSVARPAPDADRAVRPVSGSGSRVR